MDLCYTAMGRFEGFWEMKLNSWDVAAGTLIMQEAGGHFVDFKGEVTIHSNNGLSVNHHLRDATLKILQTSENKTS